MLSLPEVSRRNGLGSAGGGGGGGGGEGYSARIERSSRAESYPALAGERATQKRREEEKRRRAEEARLLRQVQLKREEMDIKAQELREQTQRRLAEYKAKKAREGEREREEDSNRRGKWNGISPRYVC